MECLRCNKLISKKALHGFHTKCFSAEFNISTGTNFNNLFEQTTNSVTAPRSQKDPAFRRYNISFFHGKYRKYSASLEGKNYILKLGQPDCLELPIIEYICNQLAKKLRIKVPDFHLIKLQNTNYAFVSRNFMDGLGIATTDHLYKFLGENYRLDCQTLLKAIQKHTGRLTEVERFLEICLFDSWIGNSDRHGRNLALITKAGQVRILSPFYDNPSYIGIADTLMLGVDLQPKGYIFTAESEEPSMKDYVKEFRRLGMEPVIQKFKQKLINNRASLIEIVQSSKILSEPRKKAFINLLEKRLLELENA